MSTDDPLKCQAADVVVFADRSGSMTMHPNSAEFWASKAGGLPAGYLVSQHRFVESWPRWERHPRGDEIVVILAGSLTLIFEEQGPHQRRTLYPGELAMIPEGRWHTADLAAPATGLFFTYGRNTEHKPRRSA